MTLKCLGELRNIVMVVGIGFVGFLPMNSSASIMGENSLDDFGQTLCAVNTDDGLGKDAPPVGRLMLVHGTGEYQIGSAALVTPPVSPTGSYRKDIVVGAGHSLRMNGVDVTADGGRVVFRIWERMRSDECVENEYEIAEAVLGPDHPESSWSRGMDGVCRHPSYFDDFHPIAVAGSCLNGDYDFAILRLTEEVRSYFPLELGDPDQVTLARSGSILVGTAGFAYHESTKFGEMLSAVACNLRVPPAGHLFAENDNLFIHDCDSTAGFSGAPFLLTDHNPLSNSNSTSEAERRRFNRYFVGINIKGADLDQGEFNPMTFFNTGVAVGPEFRQAFHYLVGSP